jgi:hypothetical protein
MHVFFGRENGEKTLGEVIRKNPTKAVVRTLESRGDGRGSFVGAEWRVPYSMLSPATNVAASDAPIARPAVDHESVFASVRAAIERGDKAVAARLLRGLAATLDG